MVKSHKNTTPYHKTNLSTDKIPPYIRYLPNINIPRGERWNVTVKGMGQEFLARQT